MDFLLIQAKSNFVGEANKYITQLIEILFTHGDLLKCLRASLLCLHLINSLF